jgi:curved DNA-binding protein CbpA
MSDSPVSATPYEVLGVPSTASDDDLKVAYRRLLRLTHPDTGGDQASFIAVQLAWERVGTPESRAAYDRSRGSGGASRAHWAPRSAPERPDTRPKARAYGHPGGWRRERYLLLMREWAGRGAEIDDPYDPALVTSAPRELRRILADALAEEATARILSDLGIGFTVWHDVATYSSEDKIDHVVLGPTGLFALLSEDYGGAVSSKRGELIGDVLGGYQPAHELATRATALSREARVSFSALVIVLPDDALASPYLELGKRRGASVIAVRRSSLAPLLRDGPPGGPAVGGTELFELRTRLQQRVRFA